MDVTEVSELLYMWRRYIVALHKGVATDLKNQDTDEHCVSYTEDDGKISTRHYFLAKEGLYFVHVFFCNYLHVFFFMFFLFFLFFFMS